jgi:hypothetical protein
MRDAHGRQVVDGEHFRGERAPRFDGDAAIAETMTMVVGGKRPKKRGCGRLLTIAWLGLVVACGGRSVRTTDEEAGNGANTGADATGNGSGGNSSSGNARSCDGVCEVTSCAEAPDSCEDRCSQLEVVARESGCATPFRQWIDCYWRERETLCETGSYQCTREGNAFSVCIIDYCDFHPAECALI